MSIVLDKVSEQQLRKDLPEFRAGDTVRVHVRLKEGDNKERIQPYEGVVIARNGKQASASFTVRRISFGIGVERIFPLHSPMVSLIEVVRRAKVRRAKLYYIRGRKGKAARIRPADRVELGGGAIHAGTATHATEA